VSHFYGDEISKVEDFILRAGLLTDGVYTVNVSANLCSVTLESGCLLTFKSGEKVTLPSEACFPIVMMLHEHENNSEKPVDAT